MTPRRVTRAERSRSSRERIGALKKSNTKEGIEAQGSSYRGTRKSLTKFSGSAWTNGLKEQIESALNSGYNSPSPSCRSERGKKEEQSLLAQD